MGIFSRKPTTAVALVAAAALALTGCTRGEGEPATTDGAGEARIVSLGLGDADTLLALDVTPVAIAPWGAEGDGDESGVGPWSKELLGSARPAAIYNTVSGFTADVLEQVAATEPTQIIAVNQAVDVQAQDSLEQIATWQSGMFQPADMAEAFAAKAEKRDAVFPELLPEPRGL